MCVSRRKRARSETVSVCAGWCCGAVQLYRSRGKLEQREENNSREQVGTNGGKGRCEKVLALLEMRDGGGSVLQWCRVCWEKAAVEYSAGKTSKRRR